MSALDPGLRSLGVTAEMTAAGERFQQPPYEECYAALEGEVYSMRNASFREILAIESVAW